MKQIKDQGNAQIIPGEQFLFLWGNKKGAVLTAYLS